MSLILSKSKKFETDARKSIDAYHKEIIETFDDSVLESERIQKELELLKKEYEAQEVKDYKLFNRIQELESQTGSTVIHTEYIRYMTRASSLLIEHSELNLHKKEIFSGKKNNGNSLRTSKEIYMEYLDIVEPNNTMVISSVNEGAKKGYHDLMCPNCNSETIEIDIGGYATCMDCGMCVEELFTENPHDMPAYKEIKGETARASAPKEQYKYEKMTHFDNIIKYFQAKKTPTIPQSDYNLIFDQFRRNRITPEAINYKLAKNILKKMGKTAKEGNPKRFNHYYKFIPYIISLYKGEEPPTIDKEFEDLLRKKFRMTLKVFNEKVYMKKEFNFRSSYIHYPYSIYKLIEIENYKNQGLYRDLLKCFPLLESRKKTADLDRIWSVFCRELNWKYIPTV